MTLNIRSWPMTRAVPFPAAVILLPLALGGCDSGPLVTPGEVDTIPPRMDLPATAIAGLDSLHVSGRIRDEGVVEKLTMRVDAGPDQSISITPDTAVGFSVEVKHVVDGTVIAFTAEDAAGNRSTVNVTAERLAYEVLPLGSLAGGMTVPADLNNRRQVVGRSGMPDGRWRAFIWEAGVMRALDTLAIEERFFWRFSGSRANAINESGLVVGAQEYMAVVWEDGVPRDLGLSPKGSTFGSTMARALDVNASATIVGGWRQLDSCADCLTGAFVMAGTDAVTIDESRSRASSVAIALTDAGDVVGLTAKQDCFSCTESLPFLYRDGEFSLIERLASSSRPADINEQRQVVGSHHPTRAPFIYPLAFLWQDGQTQTLGAMHVLWTSEARGINRMGDVVGVSFNPSRADVEVEGFLWRGGHMAGLSAFISDGWQIVDATAINDNGEITALARRAAGAELEAVLLIPIL